MTKEELNNSMATYEEDLLAIERGEIPNGLSEEEYSAIRKGVDDMEGDVEFEAKPQSTETVVEYADQLELLSSRVDLPEDIQALIKLKDDPEDCTAEKYEELVNAVKRVYDEYGAQLMEPVCEAFSQTLEEGNFAGYKTKLDYNAKLATACSVYKAERDNHKDEDVDPYLSAVVSSGAETVMHTQLSGAIGKITYESVWEKIKLVGRKIGYLCSRVLKPVLAVYSCVSLITMVACLTENPIIFLLVSGFAIYSTRDMGETWESIGHGIERGAHWLWEKLKKLFHPDPDDDGAGAGCAEEEIVPEYETIEVSEKLIMA